MIPRITYFLTGLAIGFALFMPSQVQKPVVIKPVADIRPAGLQLSCSRGDIDELMRVCRARARMERVR